MPLSTGKRTRAISCWLTAGVDIAIGLRGTTPGEMKRFADVARQVLDEKSPPLEGVFRTRNVLAGMPHDQRGKIPFLFDFHLTNQDNEPFFSRDLTGQTWIGSFFFSTCSAICPRQNKFLADLQPSLNNRNTSLVSITVQPQIDVPAKLRQYARQLNAGDDWIFCRGPLEYVQRIGSEYLGLPTEGEHHSSLLAVVDKWGNVRARISWQADGAKQTLLSLLDDLNAESTPPASFRRLDLTATSGNGP